MLTPPGRQPSRPVPLPLRHSLLGSVAVIVHGIRYFYCLGGHALAVAGYQPGPSLTTRRFPPPWSFNYSPSTRPTQCSSRISSAMLVRESRTSSANGAFGRHDRHDNAGMRLLTAALG